MLIDRFYNERPWYFFNESSIAEQSTIFIRYKFFILNIVIVLLFYCFKNCRVNLRILAKQSVINRIMSN